MPDEPSHDAKWYADGLSFECTQCGNCCTGPPGHVWVTDQEINTLAKLLDLRRDVFVKRYAHEVNGRWSLNESLVDGRYDCVFLEWGEDGKGRCGVYDARPTQCRTWPFWPENLDHPRDWQRASRGCPGINHGRRYTLHEIEIGRDATPVG